MFQFEEDEKMLRKIPEHFMYLINIQENQKFSFTNATRYLIMQSYLLLRR